MTPSRIVCVNGGAVGISQPMSTLMTMKVATMPMVPPSGVVSVLLHLEYPSNVFGYAIDLTQPVVHQLRNASLGATLCSSPLACSEIRGWLVMTSGRQVLVVSSLAWLATLAAPGTSTSPGVKVRECRVRCHSLFCSRCDLYSWRRSPSVCMCVVLNSS